MAMEDLNAVASDVDPAIVGEAVVPDNTDDTLPSDAPEGEVPAEAAGELPIEPVEEFTQDGRSIPQAVRAAFKDSSFGKDVRGAWMERAAMRELFPEGPKQAQQLLAQIEEMGGRDGLETLRTSRAELQEIDQLLQTGSPKLLDLVQGKSPEAIAALAPEVVTRWSQVDPDGYQRAVSGQIVNAMRSSDLGSQFQMAAAFLNKAIKQATIPNLPPEVLADSLTSAVNHFNEVTNWINSQVQTANAPGKPKAAPDPEIETRARTLDDREMKLFDAGLNRSIEENRAPIIDRELKPFLPKNGELSSVKREIFMDALLKRERATLEADKQFVAKWNSYRSAKDEKGASAAMRNKLNAILPGIVQQVAREMFGSPAKPKPAAPVTTKPATPAVRPPATPQDSKEAHLNSMFSR